MNCYREGKLCCYFHPNEVIVGICSICLRERLLILASKDTDNSFRILRRKHSISLPKVFAVGSFLQRLESRHHREDDKSDEDSLESLEDSFISIKFEENGIASWDNKKSTCIKPSSDAATAATTERKDKKEMRSVVQHTKRGAVMLRWRRRIGQLLQMARWKRSSKAASCHAGLGAEVDGGGVKGIIKRGWIRSLTGRRTNNDTE